MGYLFVDRILKTWPGEGGGEHPGALGIKSVSRWDPFVRTGPRGELELSPCFAGEAVGQLAAWLAMSRCGFRRRPVAGLTAEALVGKSARPGDLILLAVDLESQEEDAVHYHGTASVGGEPILTLRHAVGPMLPMEDFDDPGEVERQFRGLLRPAGAESDGEAHPEALERPGREPAAAAVFRAEDHPAIDAILERDPRRILAATCVSRAAPWAADHFPRNPVLPATLLLDGQVALAISLVSDAGAPGGGRPSPGSPGPPAASVSRLSDLKMRDFARPGSRVLSEIRIRERSGDRFIVDLSARISGRVVLSGTVELVHSRGAGV